jgi:hypothetical protein
MKLRLFYLFLLRVASLWFYGTVEYGKMIHQVLRKNGLNTLALQALSLIHI